MVYIPSENMKLFRRARTEGWDNWIRTVADERAVYDGCYFDENGGLRVMEFFTECLCYPKSRWKGKPFVPMDWQRDDLLMPMYSWRNADGTRRFNICYIEVPKKNGKSGLCSGLGLYHLMADGEESAEVYTAAADRDQAKIVHTESKNMIEISPRLKTYEEQGLIDIVDSKNNIVFWPTGSRYKALSAEHSTKEGLDWSAVIFDELHAQKNPDLWHTLRYGGVARLNWMLIVITTAGWDKRSICYQQHVRAEKVLDGTIEDSSFFAYIRAADPKEDDWKDPATWRKANPSLGSIITERDMAHDCQEAQDNPLLENEFKRYRLNIWTEQAVLCIRMSDWDKCGGAVDPGRLMGRSCYGALDLSSRTDLSAFVLTFPNDDGETYDVLVFFWVPEENALRREKKDKVPYLQWIKRGYIKATEGNVVDHNVIREDIKHLGDEYDIEEIAYDPWHATQLALDLEDHGFTMIEFRQILSKLSAPMKKLLGDILSGAINHGNNPVLRWMASNTAARTNANEDIRPDKDKSTDRIDGIVALIMAIDRLSRQESGSVYDNQEVFAC